MKFGTLMHNSILISIFQDHLTLKILELEVDS